MNNRLKVIRAERKMTQEDLAKLVGLSRPGISQIENGLSTPSGETMLALSKKLNMPIEEIFIDFVVLKVQNNKKS